jgi:hypothetical protein
VSLKKEQKNSIEMLCKNHLTLKPKWVKSLDGKINEVLQLLRSLRTTIILEIFACKTLKQVQGDKKLVFRN